MSSTQDTNQTFTHNGVTYVIELRTSVEQFETTGLNRYAAQLRDGGFSADLVCRRPQGKVAYLFREISTNDGPFRVFITAVR